METNRIRARAPSWQTTRTTREVEVLHKDAGTTKLYTRAAQTYLHAGPVINLSDWSRAICTV